MRVTRFEHRFVDHFPDRLDPGVLYVSLPFTSVAHGCACGCGKEVVTPLSPTDWQLTFDGKSISLYPSIGNWAFPCRSHYWIKHGVVEWSYNMSHTEIEAGRRYAQATKRAYYNEEATPAKAQTSPVPPAKSSRDRKGALSRFVDWLNEK